jgi:hypothetical protein
LRRCPDRLGPLPTAVLPEVVRGPGQPTGRSGQGVADQAAPSDSSELGTMWQHQQMTHEADTCAVWFRSPQGHRAETPGRGHHITCELFDSEQDAARFAVHFDAEWQGIALGVQFSDGRTLKVDQWPAYAERRGQWEAVERSRQSGSALHHVPMRPTRDPFTGEAVEVGAFQPAWLGRADDDDPAGGAVPGSRRDIER